ncbi:MAG: cation-translocating P-type ATPase [Candidatus Nanoarchaeia archaeon]|nr:cation-translocating P-type ATPase [Candidatus Nanoarchaeia archaeon]MDD5740373.1 cation-translocating P-type ATPase [Candidatus Nanoarchaeia archaeon]
MVLELEHDKITGLTEKEAARRIKSEGYNEIAGHNKNNIFSIVWGVLKEPMFILLIACGLIYVFLGDIKEAMMLLFCVFVIIGINIYQENKTEKTLDALRDLSSPRAVVIRDKEKKRIAGREVVRGDILILSEGDRVPADAIILSCSNMQVDESLLTGESVPVRKAESRDLSKISTPGGDDLPFLYSGTLVVSGTCIAEVIGIGMNTEMGKIGKSLQTLTIEKTSLQTEVNTLVKYFAIWGLFLCAIVVIIYGLTRKVWLQSFLTGITLAMSLLPEEFPVVLTIFLALGAWRMSRKKVLARRQHAIQMLGSATVLCVDKTGTLTMNKMSIKKVYSKGKFIDLSKKELDTNFYEIIETGILASQKDPFDPMEKALKNLSQKIGFDKQIDSWKLIKDFPLTRKILATSEVWESEKKEFVIATKGAPETILELCHLNSREKQKLFKEVAKMASEGLRVIGVAKAKVKKLNNKEEVHDFDFNFIGFLGFEDPVRPSVASAIKECYNAGIKVIMITGDYPVTAKNIASQIGLKECELITGQELDKLDDNELKKRISNVCIFARVVPEQKLRIVNALKANGEITVMTGDGVNDAPALKSAHVGIAMGMRGTDVAREASGMVILDDDFSSIVEGVKTGRRIFDNIRKAMSYVFAVHFPIAGITLLALIFGWPLILFPAHIVFLELIIDPACSIVFESGKEEKNIMKRKPRNPKEKIFNKKTVLLSILQGIFILIIIALMFKFALFLNKTELEARTLAFATLIIANLVLILANLSWKESVFSETKLENKALIYIVIGAIVFLLLTIYVPYLRELFLFQSLNLKEWGMVILAGIIVMSGFEIIKKAIKIN